MSARSFQIVGRFIVVLVVCWPLSACGSSKITKENFDKLKLGMTLEDVQDILGEGSRQGDPSSGVAAQFGVNLAPSGSREEMYIWESGKKKITIYFRTGQMTRKDAEGL